jgi:hypothetical protein
MPGAYLWFLPRAFFYARGPWVRPAPGLPCALINRGSWLHALLGRHASRERGSLRPWLFEMLRSVERDDVKLDRYHLFRHCERSEAIQGVIRGPGLLRFARNDEKKPAQLIKL